MKAASGRDDGAWHASSGIRIPAAAILIRESGPSALGACRSDHGRPGSIAAPQFGCWYAGGFAGFLPSSLPLSAVRLTVHSAFAAEWRMNPRHSTWLRSVERQFAVVASLLMRHNRYRSTIPSLACRVLVMTPRTSLVLS